MSQLRLRRERYGYVHACVMNSGFGQKCCLGPTRRRILRPKTTLDTKEIPKFWVQTTVAIAAEVRNFRPQKVGGRGWYQGEALVALHAYRRASSGGCALGSSGRRREPDMASGVSGGARHVICRRQDSISDAFDGRAWDSDTQDVTGCQQRARRQQPDR